MLLRSINIIIGNIKQESGSLILSIAFLFLLDILVVTMIVGIQLENDNNRLIEVDSYQSLQVAGKKLLSCFSMFTGIFSNTIYQNTFCMEDTNYVTLST